MVWLSHRDDKPVTDHFGRAGAVMDDTLLDLVLKLLSMAPLAPKAEHLLLAACDSDAARPASARLSSW
jgi:hypothetical protein